VCSRCQALHTECEYNAAEGESRLSALRRRCYTLGRERYEARDLIAQMQSRPEPEARKIYHHIRTRTHASDLDASIYETTSVMSDRILRQQLQQERSYHYQQLESNHENLQHQQQQHQQPQQQLSQHQRPKVFFQSGHTATGSTYQLPPLLYTVGGKEVSTASINTTQEQQSSPQRLSLSTQRNMSRVSAMSSSSCTSLSSFAGYSAQFLSPRIGQLPG
jgi:hypothetical protein